MDYIKKRFQRLYSTVTFQLEMSSSPLSYWQPDSSSSTCNLCSSSFSLITNRKHHCRYCGYLVCNECSLNFNDILKLNLYKVRICDKCVDKVEMENTEIKEKNRNKNKIRKLSISSNGNSNINT